MLNWEELHPFNAVHVVELEQPVDPERAEQAIRRTLESLGIATVEITATGRHFAYLASGPTAELRRIQVDSNAAAVLNEEVSSELNTPFDEGPHCPFRFFLLSSDQAGCWLGLTYHHVVGDAVAAAGILKRVLERIRGIESTGDDRPTLYPPPLRRALPDGLGLRRIPALVLGCLRDYRQLSACYRPPRSADQQHRLRFESWGLDHPASSVRALARRHGATVQDVAFAALFQELGRLYPEEQRASSRRFGLQA